MESPTVEILRIFLDNISSALGSISYKYVVYYRFRWQDVLNSAQKYDQLIALKLTMQPAPAALSFLLSLLLYASLHSLGPAFDAYFQM